MSAIFNPAAGGFGAAFRSGGLFSNLNPANHAAAPQPGVAPAPAPSGLLGGVGPAAAQEALRRRSAAAGGIGAAAARQTTLAGGGAAPYGNSTLGGSR